MRVNYAISDNCWEHTQGIYRVCSKLYLWAFSLVKYCLYLVIGDYLTCFVLNTNIHLTISFKPITDVCHFLLHWVQNLTQTSLFSQHSNNKMSYAERQVFILMCHCLGQLNGSYEAIAVILCIHTKNILFYSYFCCTDNTTSHIVWDCYTISDIYRFCQFP